MARNDRPLIIYHFPCWDGFGAAWAAWKYYGANADYVPANYGDAWPSQTAARLVYLLDFSYPSSVLQGVMEDWSIRPQSLNIHDHHKTAMDDIVPWHASLAQRERMAIQAHFDMKHSGAVLAWDHFHPDKICPALLQYVEDRDLWKFALPHSRQMAAWMRSWPYDFEIWNHVSDFVEHDFNRVVSEGEAILRFQSEQVNTMCRAVRWREIGGYDVPFVNATVFYSECGERLLELYPEVQFSAYYTDRADGKRQWGLRSRPEFDCSEIAKQYGGGGHKNAAGFVEPTPGV